MSNGKGGGSSSENETDGRSSGSGEIAMASSSVTHMSRYSERTSDDSGIVTNPSSPSFSAASTPIDGDRVVKAIKVINS